MESNGTNKLLYVIIGLLSAIIAAGLIWFFFIQPNQNATTAKEEAPALVESPSQEDATSGQVTEVQPQESQQSAAAEPSDELEDGPDCYIGHVIVTGDNVRLREEPEINDKNIIKDKKGKNLHPKKGEKLPCMDAYGDFYYVDFHGLPCYISKQFAELREND